MALTNLRALRAPALVAGVLIAIFSYTAVVREPNAGVLSYGHHEWLTAHALKFARTWWHEGAINLDLLMVETPWDIEHPSLTSRVVYPSYPSGAVLAPYVVAKAVGVEPSVSFLMKFNLALHLLIALALSWSVWILLAQRRTDIRVVASIFPGLAYLLLPGPMFWQQNVYFTDTAVIAPFACLLLLLASESTRRGLLHEVLVACVFAWGFSTDWFFASVAVTFCLVRLSGVLFSSSTGHFLRSVVRELSAPVIAACAAFGFYGWQLTKHSLWDAWRAKLALRTFSAGDGADAMSSNFNEIVWGVYSRDQYGSLGVVLMLCSFAFGVFCVVAGFRELRKRDEPRWRVSQLNFVAVAALAPVLHTYLLKNHSYLHDFSVLKFAIPLSCIPFVLLPQLVTLRYVRHDRLITFAGALLGLIFVLVLHPRYRGMVPARNPEIAQVGSFVHRNTGYDDVVFSAFAKAEPYPSEPHLLSHTLKLVHQVDSVEQLAQVVSGLPARANIVWLGDSKLSEAPLGPPALWDSAQRTSDSTLFLVRISRELFLAHYEAIQRDVP